MRAVVVHHPRGGSSPGQLGRAKLMCVCCLLQDLGGYLEDSSRVPDHAHKFTTKIDRVTPQLYYGVVITEMRVGNSSVPLDCRKVGLYTHTHTRPHTHTHTTHTTTFRDFPWGITHLHKGN